MTSSNTSKSSDQSKKQNWIAIIIVLVAIGWFVKWISTPSVDPCDCISLLELKSDPNSNVGLSNEEFHKWEKCYDEYAGPAGATLECAGK